GAVMAIGLDGIPRYTVPYGMAGGVPTVYAGQPYPLQTSLLDGGDIVPPDNVVYLDAYGQVIQRAPIMPLEDGRDPRDSRPPQPYGRGERGGGYRGRGRGSGSGANYERMENDRRYRDEVERRRRKEDRHHDDRRGGERDRERERGSRDDRDDRRRRDEPREDDRHRRRERRDKSEERERRREEEAIEATIKDLEERITCVTIIN
ncbi:hypothetical protein PFISCL1PPCAC_18917, partial [Pristionchus fissidentatus]